MKIAKEALPETAVGNYKRSQYIREIDEIYSDFMLSNEDEPYKNFKPYIETEMTKIMTRAQYSYERNKSKQNADPNDPAHYFKCQYCGYFQTNISDPVKEYTEIQTHELKCSKNMFIMEVLKKFADQDIALEIEIDPYAIIVNKNLKNRLLNAAESGYPFELPDEVDFWKLIMR